MTQGAYDFLVQRAAPRRRLWYWQVTRDGRVAAAGFQKVKADAEQRARDELALARGVDKQLAEWAAARAEETS